MPCVEDKSEPVWDEKASEPGTNPNGPIIPQPPEEHTGSDETTEPLEQPSHFKMVSAGFGFFVAGISDASTGSLIPYFIRHYEISTSMVSILYAMNFLGWFCSALSNTHLGQLLDIGAMLALGALVQVVAQALRVWAVPFPLLMVTFWLASLGQAFQDTIANSFVAGVKGSHRWLGFIHAMYAAGCLCGPLVATAIAAIHVPSRWFYFYFFPLGLAVINLMGVLIAFRGSVSMRRKTLNNLETSTQGASDDGPENTKASSLIKKTFASPPFWLLSLFFFFYLGALLTAAGWTVEYLVDVRNGDLSIMGYILVGVNGGTLLGRIFLVEVAHRLGARRTILAYAILAVAFHLVFWLVPNIIAASIAISFLGLFTGPFFAVGVNIGSKLFDPQIRQTALGFVFVAAQMGGCIFPVITGVIASHAGVGILQPFLCALLCLTAVSWMLVPRVK